MKPHRTGILFSVLYLLLTTAYIIPNHVNLIYWSIRLKALARIVNGAVEFLVFVVWSFWGGDTPLKMFIGVLILGLISRLFVHTLWKANKLRPEILFFCLLFNSAFGLLAVINSGMVVEQPFSSCEQNLSASTKVQVIVFPETG
ncbi:MAG TPA: hypothetical protein PK530_22615, partial [Anaerolineales bacterium]|nr:hypothetical protein [Anaerolineales bacterium]